VRLEPLTVDRARYEVARSARWYQRTKSERRVPAPPPEIVVRDMLAHPDPPLPGLVQMVEAPFFTADGRLVVEPGYHAASRTYYAPGGGLGLAPVPEAPSELEVAHARDLIGELLCDFPFTNEAEQAHAIAALVQPFVRGMIVGATPLFLVEKPSPGTGAGLLVEVLAWPALGRSVPVITQAREEEEWRKRLTALISGAAPIVLLDNLTGKLESAALSAVLTTDVWQDRKLGTHETGEWPVRCTWLATANNLMVSTDLARRIVRIRLDAKVERPYDRQDFRHELPAWVQEHRADLVWAALVLIQAWVAAGRPPGHASLGRFESWTRTMGGILEVAGIPSFLSNAKEFYEAADQEGAAMRDFVTRWWRVYGSEPTRVSRLYPLTTEDDSLLVLEGRDDHAKSTKLGIILAKYRDRRYQLADGLTVSITRGEGLRQGAAVWRLDPKWSGVFGLPNVTAPGTDEADGPEAHDDNVGVAPEATGAVATDVVAGQEVAEVVEAANEVEDRPDTELADPPPVDLAELSNEQTGPPHFGPRENDPLYRHDHVDEVEPPW
jgi:putative DNA primase/helicase